MTKSAEELRALLGLGSDEVLSTWVERSRVTEGLARGLSLGTAHGVSESLRQGLEDNPVFHPEPTLSAVLPGTRFWDGDAQVLSFEAPLVSASGAVEGRGETTLLDASEGESTLVFGTDDGRVLVHVVGGVVRVLRGARGLQFEAPTDPVVDVPELSFLLGEFDVSGWLRTRLEAAAAAPVWHQRVSTVGLLARLGFDAAADERAWSHALHEGDETPEDRCLAFARACDASVLEVLESVVLDRCGELSERLRMLPTLLHEGSVASFEAHAIAETRDELESLRAVLRAARRPLVASRLRELDAFAATWATTLDSIEGARLEGEFGNAVAVASPGAWWAPRLS
ncbi:MAG: hypothetical protein H6724_10200 [Sandaracinus sp.]|nr:hypothetical protein [Sandaracinus sp.]